MRWDDFRESSNVEDVRASTGGGRMGLRLGVGGTLLALAASYFLGIDPRLVLGLMSAVPEQQSAPQAQYGTPQDQQGRFIAAVLGETEDTWSERYSPPKAFVDTDAFIDTLYNSLNQRVARHGHRPVH